MKYKINEKRWDAIKAYLNKVWKNPEKYPDKGLILSMSDTETTKIFTKKRLKLIQLIKSRQPKNLSTLSKMCNRQLSAVMRDLKLLEKLHIIVLKKKGENSCPNFNQRSFNTAINRPAVKKTL